MASELGKRYLCTTCGQQVICLKAGTGPLTCCGKPVEQTEPRRLPSGD
jgi:desulfoferrodoxin-like iron-binding protein